MVRNVGRIQFQNHIQARAYELKSKPSLAKKRLCGKKPQEIQKTMTIAAMGEKMN